MTQFLFFWGFPDDGSSGPSGASLVAGKYCWIKNHQDHEKSGFWSGVLRLSLSAAAVAEEPTTAALLCLFGLKRSQAD